MTELDRLLRETVASLVAAGVADEALATVRTRRFLPRTMVPAGRAWRLGVLLLDREGRLYETGSVTRAIVPLRGVANKSAEAEARRDDRRAAARGRFAEGEVVNFGFRPADEVVKVVDGVAVVRWNADSYRPLEQYLAERVALLIEG
jgi:hypothetical protein